MTQEGTAELNLTARNEYDQVMRAIQAVEDAETDLRHARDDYDQYQRELDEQQARLEQLQEEFEAGIGFIEQADIDEMQRHIDRLSDDEDFYKANIVLATVTLASKATALIQQTGRAAASSGTFGFNVGLELQIDALEQHMNSYSEQSQASSLVARDITIHAGDVAAVRGSNLLAQDDIVIEAEQIEIIAGESRSSGSEREQHINMGYRWDLLGGGLNDENIGPNFGGGGSEADSEAIHFSNAQLQADNIRLIADGDATIAGATVHADQTLEIDAGNLNAASVQDINYSETRSQGASYSGSGGGLNASISDNETVRSLLTSLTGETVDIRVNQHTDIRGAVIAAIDDEGEDNGQLSLWTNTLHAGSLNNSVENTAQSVGVNVGSTSSLDYQDDAEHERTKTLATLGSGDIRIVDLDGSDTHYLNTDVENTEVSIYDIESHQGLSGELDTRILTEDGRSEIAEDWLRTEMIGNTIALIAGTDRVGIEDFFDETDKYNRTYRGG